MIGYLLCCDKGLSVLEICWFKALQGLIALGTRCFACYSLILGVGEFHSSGTSYCVGG